MSYTAGLRYYGATVNDYGSCLTTASEACKSATGNTFGTYGCYNTGNKRDPFPCLIGDGDVCPTTTVSVPALDVLVDAQYADVIVTGALMAFAVGFGIGMVIRMIRKLG